MGFDYTTTELLADIKRKSFVPMSQTTFSDAGILNIADEELQIGIVPLLMSVREEYLVKYEDQAITGTEVGFDIPYRAIGSKLKDVTILANPSSLDQPNEQSIPQIEADAAVYNNSSSTYLGQPSFFMRDNQVILSPSSSIFTGSSIRQYYFRRPNKLILTSGCARIVSIANNVATVNLLPTTFGTGTLYTITSDVVKAKPGFGLLTMDLDVTCNTTNLTVTFPNNLSTYNIVVGDYICLAGESPIPQIPVELMTVLAQRSAVKLLEALGDEKNFTLASNKLKEMQHAVTGMLSNRVEGAAHKVVNRFGPLSGNPFRRF